MSCNEWKEYKLEEACNISTGFAFKSKEYLDNGTYKVVRGDNVKTGFIYWEEKGRYWNDLTDKLSKYILQEKDIVIGMDGSRVGKNRAIIRKNDLPAILAQRVACVRAKADFSQDYIRYVIMSNTFEYYVDSIKTGTSIPHISMKQIGEFKFNAPSLEIQEKIADVLSSLDDKIELNNEMNKTLEEMAQSIFKIWFVDFEFPNKDGQPYKSSGGEMVESEFGMIPEGWEIKTIGDIGNIITGKTPSSKIGGCFGNEYNFITPRDIDSSIFILKTERELSSIGVDKLKRNIVPKNSVGVSCIGSNLGEVYITGEDSITNQQINTVVLNREELYPYVYIYLKNMKEDFLNMSSGSAVPIINKTSFSNINILIPNIDLLNKYVKAISCYFDRIKENIKEIESLTILRDTLLPKLINGEIIK